MTRNFVVRGLRITGAVTIIVGSALLVAATPVGPPVCERAEAWTQENLSALPRTLEDFGKYHPAIRRAVYHRLAPVEREGLWRAQLVMWSNDSRLENDQQRALIQDVLEHLPDYLAGSSGPEQVKADRVEERIRDLFDTELAGQIFFILGPTEFEANQPISVVPVNALGLSATTLPRVLSLAGIEASSSGLPDCSCAHASDFCSAGMLCSASSCALTDSGCGFLWSYPCTGACKLDM
jgi:hypothetical protein